MFNIDNEEFEFEVSEAFRFLCLFLAQNDDPLPPHKQLGFDSQSASFSSIADQFGSKKRTVQNERDAFDAFTDSNRAGWQKPLPPRLLPIFEKFKDFPRDTMFRVATEILASDWNSDEMPELPDLDTVVDLCKQKIANIDPTREVKISPKIIDTILESYRNLNKSNEIYCIGGHTFRIGTGTQSRCLSVQEIPALATLAEHLRALEIYKVKLDQIAVKMGFNSRAGEGKAFFANMPGPDWGTNAGTSLESKFKQAVIDVLPHAEDQKIMMDFVSSSDWEGRKLDRSTDWQESTVLKTGNLVAAASAGRINFIRALEAGGIGSEIADAQLNPTSVPGGKNVIYYGAPGTGKTYGIEQIIKNEIYHRTVFHPDTQNSDFVGALKPVMDGEHVTYKFAPGPFCRALADALLYPTQNVYLVIEELNRAPAAAVFGELFLLLDRSDGTHPPKILGEGDYDADFPSREMANWFTEEKEISIGRMKVPSNLSIYATMNSADQGVYPLDTAFRRRFEQEYVKIDWNATGVPQSKVGLALTGSDTFKLAWPKFASRLNRYLSERLSVQEDRFVGPYFVKDTELVGRVPGKILIYLWDDLLRHGDRGAIFDLKRNSTYGDLSEAVKDGHQIFTAELIAALVSEPDGASSGE